jgi:hypothetical protein
MVLNLDFNMNSIQSFSFSVNFSCIIKIMGNDVILGNLSQK